ncbi:hypothetical protein FEP93_04820 [Burkholderia multivorans]|uniref:branched-chain amino acid ABC transporter permease n=1 Tax=Burkholderia multivorans TaxID=87883 RepID=UPI0028666BDA|nr:branched-chain amino acid ABC transporter permease [Burkholderia multivorans]MDR8864383.1 hypothetical protein [Burkholderia multivorans]
MSTTLDTLPTMPRHLPAVRWAGAAVFIVALVCAPLVLGGYYLHALIIAMIFLLPAHGLNLILGYTGMLSLAQGVFFGIGAYTSALLSMRFGTPFMLNIVLSGIVAGVVALPLGIPALRLRTYSFVMCTLGFVVIAQTVAKNWISVTRGDMGLAGIPAPKLQIGSTMVSINTLPGYYYLALWSCPCNSGHADTVRLMTPHYA